MIILYKLPASLAISLHLKIQILLEYIHKDIRNALYVAFKSLYVCQI